MRVWFVLMAMGGAVSAGAASDCIDKYATAERSCLKAVQIASDRQVTRVLDQADRARQDCLEAFTSERAGVETIGNNLFLEQTLKQVITGQVSADLARARIATIVAKARRLCS